MKKKKTALFFSPHVNKLEHWDCIAPTNWRHFHGYRRHCASLFGSWNCFWMYADGMKTCLVRVPVCLKTPQGESNSQMSFLARASILVFQHVHPHHYFACASCSTSISTTLAIHPHYWGLWMLEDARLKYHLLVAMMLPLQASVSVSYLLLVKDSVCYSFHSHVQLELILTKPNFTTFPI